ARARAGAWWAWTNDALAGWRVLLAIFARANDLRPDLRLKPLRLLSLRGGEPARELLAELPGLRVAALLSEREPRVGRDQILGARLAPTLPSPRSWPGHRHIPDLRRAGSTPPPVPGPWRPPAPRPSAARGLPAPRPARLLRSPARAASPPPASRAPPAA